MREWKYDMMTMGLTREPLQIVTGSMRGVLWVLAYDGECYGIEASVLTSPDDRGRISIQTVIPLSTAIPLDLPYCLGSLRMWWALLDSEGRVVAAGP